MSLTGAGAGGGHNLVNLGDGTNSAVDANTGAGGDTITGGNGLNTIDTSAAHGADSITSGAGNDIITTGGGTDIISAGGGNDQITFTGQGAIQGGDGDDMINGSGSSAGSIIDAGTGNDQVFGTTGADTITGGVSNDIIARAGGGAAGSHDVISRRAADPSTFVFVGQAVTHQTSATAEVITDWNNFPDSPDRSARSAWALGPSSATTVMTASSLNAGIAVAIAEVHTTHAGNIYAAVQVGADVVVYIDSNHDGDITTADDAVILSGRALTDIAAVNFI